MTARISPAALRNILLARTEVALLDVREQGVHSQGHPFYAACLPLSHLELRVETLVPRRNVPIVLVDDRDDGLAERAAQKLIAFGYTDLSILQGGCEGWRADGGELFTGVNVPSKAFGEFVEHHFDTPRIPPGELKQLVDSGRRLVIVDSRPFTEYHRMNIPGALSMPGAELALRIHDLAPDPDTLVVVNCAGRTRSIIGCQSLRNAGIPNEVVALKDGTMGWELAGYTCEHGSERVAPLPTGEGQRRAQAVADRVAQRFQVKTAQRDTVQAWLRDPGRTTYLLDVRAPDEFERAHIAQSRHAPGGQLVQATDEYVAVRNARIVLVDPLRVRAVMTASWLNQMGWDDVHVLQAEGEDGFAGWQLERGAPADAASRIERWATLAPEALASRLGAADVAVIDLSTSLQFRDKHVPGAWWAVRARMAQARAKVGERALVVLTSGNGVLAHLAAPDAQAAWPQSEVRVLDGGNAVWFAQKRPTESGIANVTTTIDDVWYKPYEHEHESEYEKHARDYLTWEVALVEQIRRDPTVRFRS
jgi:rhodanese-related sulfurtransferase